ncbi:metal-dependent hydrolase (plasmid) [Haloarcula marismortui]|uniref:metal-dependent hydrolase n=1 Tax=Haloarcula marismortui TaxID=2238 RepID=UPI003C781E00
MTDFAGHLKIGVVISGLVAAGLIYIGQSPVVAGFAAVLALVGSILPDIDIHSSIPRRYFGYLLLTGLPIAAIYAGVTIPAVDTFVTDTVATLVGTGREIARVAGVAFLGVVGIGVALGAGKLLDDGLTHRGFTHSPVFALLLAVAVTALVTQFTGLKLQTGFLLGGGLAAGIAAHVYIGDR